MDISSQYNKSETCMLLGLVILCLLVELMGGWWITLDSLRWYLDLNKPSWTPASYVYGPIWTILYLSMAVSMWMVWKTEAPNESKMVSYILFALQLFLNFLWPILFFGTKSPLLGFITTIFLFLAILGTIWSFHRINRIAAYILIPYCVWVLFAVFLNAKIWLLNW